MSFYTSAVFYRPTKPPRVTAASLGRFLLEFERLQVSRPVGLPFSVRLKFGKSIDQDRKSSAEFVETVRGEYAIVGHYEDIPWNIETEDDKHLAQVAQALERDTRTVYRASIHLGTAHDEICDALTFPGVEDDPRSGFYPGDLSLALEPAFLARLDDMQENRVGWMSLDYSGHFHLHPWTVDQVVRRLEGHEAMQRIMSLLRSTWPVPSVRPNLLVRRKRGRLATNFPYPLDAPQDWFWGISESG